MSENQNKPVIRFEGFTDAWEQCRLGDVSTSFSGGTPTAGKKEYYGGSIPFIRSAEINSDVTELFITQEGLNSSSAKVVDVGDILYAMYGATSGEVGIARISGAINQAILSVKPNAGYDAKFIMKWLRAQKQNITNTYLQGGQGNLSGNIVKDLEIKFPLKDEQTKIGSFFSTLDHTITFHQRKLEKSKIIKKAMLEKLFPKNGSDKPEIRFKGFTDAWDQCELGKLGNTFTGLSGKTKEDFGHGNAKFVTYVNVFNNPIADSEALEAVEVDSKQNEVQYGDVFFTTSSETPEEVGMSSVWLNNSVNTYLNSFCFGYRPTEKFDPYYLAFMLRSSGVRKKFLFLAQGISRYNISKTKVMEMNIPVPSIDEQVAIGNFFSTLDRTITFHQHQLEKLQNIKKSLLEKMFV